MKEKYFSVKMNLNWFYHEMHHHHIFLYVNNDDVNVVLVYARKERKCNRKKEGSMKEIIGRLRVRTCMYR